MAIRTKTIEYAFLASEGNVAAGGARAFTQITVNIPETVGRVFKSCFLIVYVQDNVVAAASPTSWRIQAAVGGVALDTTGDGATLTDTITNSGEQCAWLFTRDVTSLFTGDTGAGGWMDGGAPATSRTFDVTLTVAVSTTCNASCKLVITYDYSDAATTRIKTVKIPIESVVGALAAAGQVEIGTNQVPLLDTFCPEANKTFRDIFFEIYVNDGCNGTTDYTLNLSLDAEGADASGTIEAGLQSARSMYYLWKRTDMTTNATHAFKAAVSNVAGGTFDCIGVILVVTYEYNETNTTTVLNSIQMPAFEATGFLGGTVAGDLSRNNTQFFIEEPETITLKQSAVQIFLIDSGAVTLNVKAGAQAARAYTLPARVSCGGWGLVHRIDSGGAQGAGIILARGLNTLSLDLYTGSATYGSIGTAASAILFLNYTSGKATGGTQVHNQTISWFSAKTIADTQQREFSTFAPVINETDYYLNGIGFFITQFVAGTTQGYQCLTLKTEWKSGEGPSDGWNEVYSGLFNSDAEEGVHIQVGGETSGFKRYPADPDTNRKLITTTRKYRIECVLASYTSFFIFYTYHCITRTISGTIRNYSGDGSGITVEIHRSDTDEKIVSTTTIAGGTFSVTWYDNTINCYAHAKQDTNHVGRSDDALAS
jgi:hypothetical protein